MSEKTNPIDHHWTMFLKIIIIRKALPCWNLINSLLKIINYHSLILHLKYKSHSSRNPHIANTAIISIGYPRESTHPPVRTPWVLYLPSQARLVSNEHNRMVNIAVAIVENSAWIKLKSIPCDSNRYRAIIKLIDQSSAITLLYVLERGHFKSSAVFFASSSHSRYSCCIRIIWISLNTLDLHVCIRAFQKATVASISQAIRWTINYLLGRKRNKKSEFIDWVKRANNVRRSKSIARTTDSLIPDFSRMDCPVDGINTEIAWTGSRYYSWSGWICSCGICQFQGSKIIGWLNNFIELLLQISISYSYTS